MAMRRGDSDVLSRVACAGAGFLLAVLWFDLMFDVQVLGRGSGLLPDAVLASMADYYRRVTTDSWPMGALLAIVMAITFGATVLQVTNGKLPRLTGIAALVLSGSPILLALVWILPQAAQLGMRMDSLDVQSHLARAICYEHIACFASIGAFLALQLTRRDG